MSSIRVRNTSGNSGNGGGGTITVTFPDTLIDLLSKDAEFVPYCVEYDLNGVFTQDSVVIVSVYDIDDAQIVWQGLFSTTGTSWQPYSGVPLGATNIQWIAGGCTSVNAIAEGVEIGLTAAADALADAIADALANSTAFAEAIANAVSEGITLSASALANAIAEALAEALGRNFELTQGCVTLSDGTTESVLIAQTMNADTSALEFQGFWQYNTNGALVPYVLAPTSSFAIGSCADLATLQTYTDRAEFCNKVDNGNGSFTFVRYVVITVLNTATNQIVRQSIFILPNYAPYAPVTSGQSEIQSPECCQDCPDIVNVETACVEVLDPCDPETWDFVLDIDKGEASVTPILGNNATATIAWVTTGGIVANNPTAATTSLNITGPGTITATVTVATINGNCDIVFSEELICDISVSVQQNPEVFIRRYDAIRVDIGSNVELINIEIDGVIYLPAQWAAATGNTAPIMLNNAGLLKAQNFMNWALLAAGKTGNVNIAPAIGGSTYFILKSCEETTAIVTTDSGQPFVFPYPFVFQSWVLTDLDCGDNVMCLTADVVEGVNNIGNVTGYQWYLNGLQLVAGATNENGICVAGTGTWVLVVQTDLCADFTEQGVIGNLCGNQAQIQVTNGGEVCAGLEAISIFPDDVNKKITFQLVANDSVPIGVNITNKKIVTLGGTSTGSRNNMFAHPDDPNFATHLNVTGDTATFVADYPQESDVAFVGNGISSGGGTTEIKINGAWSAFAIIWNEATDPTGSAFKNTMQLLLDALEATANCTFEAGVYVAANKLHIIVRGYGNGTVSTGSDGIRYKVSATAAVQTTIIFPFLSGIVAYRTIETPCGTLCYALRFRYQYNQSGHDWSTVVPADFVLVQEQWQPMIAPYNSMPECCSVPTVLSASLQNTNGFTITAYSWSLGSGLSLASGQLTDQNISVLGSGIATVQISTLECGNFTKNVTI